MSDRVDELFSGGLPPPQPENGPRLQRIEHTLWVAIALNVLGIPCWTSVPGAALTLWVWLATDADAVRPMEGELTSEEAAHLVRLRSRATAALLFCIAALIVQIFLLSTSFYDRLWGSVSVAVQHLWQAVL